MIDSKPTTIGRYFWDDVQLSPAIPEKKFWRPRWVLLLKYKLAKLYWKKTNPLKYAKCVCSLMAAALHDTDTVYDIPVSGTLRAPATVSKLTEQISDVITMLTRDQVPTNMLPLFLNEMTWMEWAGGQQVTDQVWAQTRFVWTVATVLEGNVHKESTEARETLSTLKSWLVPYTTYIEELLEGHFTHTA